MFGIRRFAIVILEVGVEFKPSNEDKEYLRKVITESLNWWHQYLGRGDRLNLGNWRVYRIEWVDEVALARALSAIGKGKDYVREGLGQGH